MLLIRNLFPAFITFGFIFTACNNPDKPAQASTEKHEACDEECIAKSDTGTLVCGLSTPEQKKRKATVLASLKKQVLEKKELPDGYAFRFNGSDETFDELTEFIKTERECCGFFTFNLSVSGDKKTIWLELTGIDGAKEFVTEELGL